MSNTFKDVDLKSRTYYFFNDMMNINNFDANNVKIDTKTLLFSILDMWRTIKVLKYVKVNKANSLYLFFCKVSKYYEEINGIKYLALVPTNESKKIIKKNIRRTME